jgi:hypothetical protein
MISKKCKTNIQILEANLKKLLSEKSEKSEKSENPIIRVTSGAISAPLKAKGMKKNELISTKRLLTQ